MLKSEDLVNKIRIVFPDAKIAASDLTGTGDHWRVVIVASEFAGKSLVEQHQMVYAALGTWMHKEIHALSLDTKAA